MQLKTINEKLVHSQMDLTDLYIFKMEEEEGRLEEEARKRAKLTILPT